MHTLTKELMIYLEPELQHRLIPTCHYALKPDGVLFLSSSESITTRFTIWLPINPGAADANANAVSPAPSF